MADKDDKDKEPVEGQSPTDSTEGEVSTPGDDNKPDNEDDSTKSVETGDKENDSVGTDTKDEEPSTEETTDETHEDTVSDSLDTDTWGDTGDEVGNSVLFELQSSGISTEDAQAALLDAVADGDATKIDVALLESKVGKSKATVIRKLAESFIADRQSLITDTVNRVHKSVGGEDNWNTVVTWANKNMDSTELQELSTMMDRGGKQAEYAAREFLVAYNNDSNNTTLDTSGGAIEGDAASGAKADGITHVQSFEQRDKAYRTLSGKALDNELAKIEAARARGRKQGI